MIFKEQSKEQARPVRASLAEIGQLQDSEITSRLQTAYAESVSQVMRELGNLRGSSEREIRAAVRRGDMDRAQELIDATPPFFEVNIDGNNVSVVFSEEQQARIRQSLEANQSSFVSEMREAVIAGTRRGQPRDEIPLSLSGDGAEYLAERFASALGSRIGVEPPSGVNLDEGRQQQIAAAGYDTSSADIAQQVSVSGNQLPLHVSFEGGTVYVGWPTWMPAVMPYSEEQARLQRAVPRRTREA